MAFNRDLAWDILAEFNGQVEHGFTPVGYIGVDNTVEYDSALDQLAKLGEGFDRDRAWEILVEFSMLADDGPAYIGLAFIRSGADNTAAFDSALDQLATCYA